jgi:hypothetical protein
LYEANRFTVNAFLLFSGFAGAKGTEAFIASSPAAVSAANE